MSNPKIESIHLTENGNDVTYDITLSSNTDLEIKNLYLTDTNGGLYLTPKDGQVSFPSVLNYDGAGVISLGSSYFDRLKLYSGNYMNLSATTLQFKATSSTSPSVFEVGRGNESNPDVINSLGVSLSYNLSAGSLGNLTTSVVYGPKYIVNGVTKLTGVELPVYTETKYGQIGISYTTNTLCSTSSTGYIQTENNLYFPDTYIENVSERGKVIATVSSVSAAISNSIHKGTIIYTTSNSTLGRLILYHQNIRFWVYETISSTGRAEIINCYSVNFKVSFSSSDLGERYTVNCYLPDGSALDTGTMLSYEYIS